MKNQQTWYAVDVSLVPETVEAIEYALAEAGASGTEYSTLGKKEIGETVSVTGYFDAAPDLQNIQSEIENALAIYDLPADSVKEISIREVENKDWLEEWKKTWQPTKVGKFIIAPSWSGVEPDESDEEPYNWEIVIRIDPEMAFGTGTHETTQLCLRAIQEIDVPGCSFLDVGTGTGILAIAFAVESHNQLIVAYDTDANSIEIARKNAALNNVADEIEFYVGSIEQINTDFEYVCANLTADVILPMLPQLLEKTTFDLILSGILREQLSLIENELMRLNVTQWKVRTMGEWICVIADCRSISN